MLIGITVVVMNNGSSQHMRAMCLSLQERTCVNTCSPVISDQIASPLAPCYKVTLRTWILVGREWPSRTVARCKSQGRVPAALPGLIERHSFVSIEEGPGGTFQKVWLASRFWKRAILVHLRTLGDISSVSQESGQVPGGPALMDR